MDVSRRAIVPERLQVAPRSLRCPTCDAFPGQHCYTRGGFARWGYRGWVLCETQYYACHLMREHGPRVRLARALSEALALVERHYDTTKRDPWDYSDD